jgi:hypothetical protein
VLKRVLDHVVQRDVDLRTLEDEDHFPGGYIDGMALEPARGGIERWPALDEVGGLLLGSALQARDDCKVANVSLLDD